MKSNTAWAAMLALLLTACGSSEVVDSNAPPPDNGSEAPPDDTPPASFVAVPFVSAHRGGAAYAPEDTMTAYRNAARLGVDDFETDMLLTADGVAVLIHDDTLDRTTSCTGNVADKTYAEILDCDAGYWWSPGQATTSADESREHPLRGKGVVVPTAEELFAFAASFQGDYAPTVTIEIKIAPADPDGSIAAAALVELIHASGIQDRIIVQSFNPLAIQNVKMLDSTIKTLYLTPSGAYLSLAYATAGGHEYVAPSFDSPDLDADFVDAAHAAGKLVEPWTADSQDDIQTMIDIGVDGIITNYPGCLLQIQGRLHTAQLATALAGDVGVNLCK